MTRRVRILNCVIGRELLGLYSIISTWRGEDELPTRQEPRVTSSISYSRFAWENGDYEAISVCLILAWIICCCIIYVLLFGGAVR